MKTGIMKIAAGLLALLCLTGCAEENLETTGPALSGETAGTEAAVMPTTEPVEGTTAATEPERYVLTFTGDSTLGSNLSNAYAQVGFPKTVGEDYGFPYRNVIEYFENDDLTLVNLEGPLTDESHPVEKKHVFRGPTAYTAILTENSVEAVSLANNHALDHAQKGYDDTLAALEAAGIPYIERDRSTILTLEGGLTVGIYGAVYYKLDVEDMTAEIRDMKDQGVDLVIYAPHWGVEYTYQPTGQQTEVGHAAIDAGADIVWASHPHVLQPIEEYNGGVIFYSMGNFSFGGNGDPDDYDTALIQQEILRDREGNICFGERTIVPCCVSSVPNRNNYQPTPYEPGSEGYARVLAKLNGTWKP